LTIAAVAIGSNDGIGGTFVAHCTATAATFEGLGHSRTPLV
jgi:hypothetical protein